ncbi:MAG: hypothetical protein N2Z72_07600, partial [Bacteroidales bacterium]|nr:hypothetical protein [Bacteroidales bacterium]
MKIYFLLFCCYVLNVFSQLVFWSEGFGTGCNQGQLANGFTSSNGTWTVTNTGTNGNYANQWYVSATENGQG